MRTRNFETCICTTPWAHAAGNARHSQLTLYNLKNKPHSHERLRTEKHKKQLSYRNKKSRTASIKQKLCLVKIGTFFGHPVYLSQIITCPNPIYVDSHQAANIVLPPHSKSLYTKIAQDSTSLLPEHKLTIHSF